MTTTSGSWLQQHPVLALVAVNLVLFALLAGLAELSLRLFVQHNPGYYVSVSGTDRVVEYPYGTIRINSHGFPDDEIDPHKTRRVGYFGDSVTYGVGAGYGYRVSELLEREYTEYDHLNFGGIGLSVSDADIEYLATLASKFRLEKAIYLFNLNDILPDEVASGDVTTVVGRVRSSKMLDAFDWLRGRSYLYAWIRNKVRNFLAAQGTGFHGYPTYEFFPARHDDVIRQTAGRLNRFHDVLAENGTELIIVMLPYEMQISSEAEDLYAEHGIRWGSDFIAGATQRAMDRYLDESVRRYDALEAFSGRDGVGSSRTRHPVGKYFVYNKGDKLDWNHPTRDGHRAISEYLIGQRILADPASEDDGPAQRQTARSE